MKRASVGRVVLLVLLPLGSWAQTRLELAWPTPNRAYEEGRPLSEFMQPTASGEVESGLFGCARSGGAQFHEGLDLKPVSRNRKGVPLDDVYAAMNGVVRHISLKAGSSSYGRYLVLEHPETSPPVYTLYAHLAQVAPGIRVGDTVRSGQTIATMGHTAGGYSIPLDRAHLHFEIGLWMTRDFQAWYTARKFGSPNEHGIWNGMNLQGIDALDFYNQIRARRVDGFAAYFARMQPVARVRIATRTTPDFVRRYPALVRGEVPLAGVAGWEIQINATGMPFAWTPLSAMDVVGYRADEVRILEADTTALRRARCKSLVVSRRGSLVPGKDLTTTLQQLFGLR